MQRGNPEMQRRAQEVIDRCWQLGENNPILSIHDVGAGGISNALPELVHGSGRGGRFGLRDVPSEESGMSPMQIWCNESQERYVLAIAPESLAAISGVCERERCPYAVIGEATADQPIWKSPTAISATSRWTWTMSVLLGKPPKMTRNVSRVQRKSAGFRYRRFAPERRRLARTAPAGRGDKTFLISIGDRTVGGLTARDQMVGPWQVPVADVAVTMMGYRHAGRRGLCHGRAHPAGAC